MGIDWTGVASSSGGGGLWAQHGTPGTTHQRGGGGGAYAGILAGPSTPAHHGSGGLLGFAENALHGVESTITNAPRGIESLAGHAWYDLRPQHLFSPKFLTSDISTWWKDPRGLGGGVARPLVQSERAKYGSVFAHPLSGKAWEKVGHNVYKDPFGTVLDAATVASLGGVGALKAAERGALGGRALELAKAPRVLKSSRLEEPLNQARTLQGRALQRSFDKLSMSEKRVNTPIIGMNPRLAKISEVRKYRQTIRASMPAREFQRVTAPLSKDEKFAFHIGAEGVPLHERIDFYRKELRDNPTAQLRDYVHRLESPGVAKVLDNPSQKFVAALHEGANLQETATQRLIDAGQLTRETHTARSTLPQEIMSSTPPPLTFNRVHEALPPAFRFPHIGDEASKPGLFTTPSNAAGLRPPQTPGFLKHSEAVRLRAARLMTNPEVLTRDYLATMRHEHLNEMRAKVLRPVSKSIDHALERTGFKRPDESYFYEKRSTRVPRSVTQQEAMSRDLGMVDVHGHETELGMSAKQNVFQTAADAPTAEIRRAIESGDAAKLEELGVRRIPAAFAKRYNANFASTGKMMRLFWDKPLDVWRAMTLNLRPAWMVNNLVGNAAQYALRYAGIDGAAAFLRALLTTERGDSKFLQIRNYTMRIPTLRRKYGRIFDEIAPEVHGTGLYSTHLHQTKGGVYQSTIDAATATKVARVAGVPVRILKAGLTAIPKGITAFERHFAEAVPREAAMMVELQPVIRKLGLTNMSWEDALKTIAKGDVEQGTREMELATDRMLDYMGDFNSMNANERRVLKRLVPFEAWYRVILQVSGKFLVHYPARVNLLRSIGQAYEADNQDLPSWLKGAIPTGPEKGGVQPMLTTMGLNPYETIPQLATQNPAGIAAFGLQGLATGVTGVDPFTQGAYRGIGASKGYDPLSVLKRTAGSTFEGLVPTRLYQQTVGTPPSYLYQPKTYGHVGPVAINDALLQYLGLPIRHVKKGVAKTYAREGR